ncbi:MAG: flagellar hook-basal body complex protein FliE [Actinomycetia bacterium]|nr:flagellar hook-basal body complex protein FliE [Actinomycetes bacterium]MCP4960838.1 flagellar hook-basal body complex protein FliE [Actinomycetes bacterium]
MIPSIAGVAAAGSPMSVGAAAESAGGFGETLQSALQSVSDKERNADSLVTALAAGEDVELSDVLVATTEAALTVELLVTVRDQAVSAYQQIASLQL